MQTSNQLIISACPQIWNIFFVLGAALCVNGVGRHKLFVTSAAIISGTYVANTGLTGSFVTTVHAPTAIASLAVDLHIFCRVRYSSLSGAPFFAIHLPVFRLRPFTDTQYHRTPLLTSYPIEIWPYRLRSRGFLVIWTSCIVAVIFHTSLIPLPLMVSGGNTT